MNLAEALNLGCACRTLDPALLCAQLETEPALLGLTERLSFSHPHLFSSTAVFLDEEMWRQVALGITALERVIALPGYVTHVLEGAPAIAQHAFGPVGAFMGYDFHIGNQGPRLIEINTNAGGAFLNAALARAHSRCCTPMSAEMPLPLRGGTGQPEAAFMAMFKAEWQAQRGDAQWRTVLILDDAPETQYLAPEFEMARRLFAQEGLAAVVADPRDLRWHDQTLWHPALPEGWPVDLVYNRLTDFDLAEPSHAALRAAYEAGATVVTPHPRAHALHANKRNLAVLSDDAMLASWGASAADREILNAMMPRTELVTTDNADALWARRRSLFFKPLAGYGGKAAFRGDKLTRKSWAEITQGGFVAQELVPPSERLVDVDGQQTRLKLDLRAYSYRGQIQLLAARTYSGQTTNFRTAGGGFSPVVVLPAALSDLLSPACRC